MIDRKIVWTIGHSTRPFEEFADLLVEHQIQQLIDIRRYPGSRKFPQYNKETLAKSLAELGIRYTHIEGLGGRRNPRPDSINMAWRVRAFRGYADYMETDEFKNSVNKLELLASSSRCVYMCSEAVWWSCHRALVSDYLKMRGWEVIHILSKDKDQEHPYTKAATIIHGALQYTL